MGIVVDIIIVAILILCILYGYKKGLIKVATKLLATVIAIVVTLILYIPISNLIINATSIDESIQNVIYENVSKNITTKNSDNSNENYLQTIQGQLVEDAKNNILPETSRKLAINIIHIGVMILLFVALKIGISLIKVLTDKISKLPIIKQFDKVGGVIYGLLIGFVIIFVSLAIIKVVDGINPQNPVSKNVEKSSIGGVLYNNNVIDIFIK